MKLGGLRVSLVVVYGLCDGLHHLKLLGVRQVARMRSVSQYVRADINVSPDMKKDVL